METVKTKEAPPSSSFPETRIICRVCEKQFSKYTCPRCNSRYCSLQCYKGHSLRCTESFMRNNVMEEMRQMQPEDEGKKKMLEILQRFHSEEEMDYEDDDDDDDSVIAEGTIQKILSGNNVCFEDLSPNEMKRFQRAVASGELSKMIEPWEPWWFKPSARKISLSQDGNQLVSPVDKQGLEASTSGAPDDNLSEIPVGPETPLQPLSSLSRTNPSPLLPIHLVDILYSYCLTLRLYNGDWQCDPLGATTVVLSISSVLSEGGQPETVAEALGNCLERTCSPIYRHAGGFQFGLGLLDDVVSVLSLGTNALICLLSDLQRLTVAGDKMLESEKRGNTKGDETKSKLRNAKRKVYFLMCWVHEQPGEAWLSLASIVDVEKASLKSLDCGYKPVKVEGKGGSQSGVLIEEV